MRKRGREKQMQGKEEDLSKEEVEKTPPFVHDRHQAATGSIVFRVVLGTYTQVNEDSACTPTSHNCNPFMVGLYNDSIKQTSANCDNIIKLTIFIK